MATSVPIAPIAIPMSAVARAGASLTPSPTIAVGCWARSRAMMADLSSGRRSACTWLDAGLAGERGGGALVVAGEHGDGVAVGVQPGHDLGGFGPELVADRDRADDLPVDLDQDRGGAGFLHPVDPGGQVAGREPAGTSESDGARRPCRRGRRR
jgi:hypothetical protein